MSRVTRQIPRQPKFEKEDSQSSSTSWSSEHSEYMDESNHAPKARRGTRTRAATKVVAAPPPSQADVLPWQHNKHTQYKLMICEQPEDEFYKDQGGKNHHLSTTLRLVPEAEVPVMERSTSSSGLELGDLGKQSTIEIPLKTTLLYDNGVQVEEQAKSPIFKSMIKDDDFFKLQLRYSRDIQGWVYEGQVNFRLEKVSLRCDGKKFKLAIEIDTDAAKLEAMNQQSTRAGCNIPTGLADWVLAIAAASAGGGSGVGGVETVGINVLSKKKTNHPSHTPTRHNDDATSGSTRPRSGSISRGGGGGGGGGSQKRQRTGASSSGHHHDHSPVNDASGLAAKMDKMENLLSDVLDYVKAASERMDTLDENLKELKDVVSGRQFSLTARNFAHLPSRGMSALASDQDARFDDILRTNSSDSQTGLPLPLTDSMAPGNMKREPSWVNGNGAAQGGADAGLGHPQKLNQSFRQPSWGPIQGTAPAGPTPLTSASTNAGAGSPSAGAAAAAPPAESAN